MTRGVCWGVGVGPGDPELITLKAARVLERCPVIAAPRTKSGEMLALDIVRGAAITGPVGQDHPAPGLYHVPGPGGAPVVP